MPRSVILHRGAVHSDQPLDYARPRFVRPASPELLARVMRDDDAYNAIEQLRERARAEGGQFSRPLRLAANFFGMSYRDLFICAVCAMFIGFALAVQL